METPIQSDNLKLVLANGKGSEFFVRSMVLDEGLGIIPTARLELCSSAPGSVVEMNELKRYLGMAATVEFKHLDVKGGGEVVTVVSTRWMSGRVSSVEHLGVIDARNDGSEPVCGYRMTIRPSLSRLCLGRSRYQFANSTVRDVLKILLDSCCEGEYAFPGQGCHVLNATRDFSQGDETDYEFFVRILASCGLSYHFQMNRAYSSPTAPKLHIIAALPNGKQLSGIETNYASGDDSKVTLCYKLPMLDGCIGSMAAWEMSQSDGVEGCAASFDDAGGECLSGESIEAGKTGKTGVIRLNHVPFDNIRSKDEVKKEVGVFLKSMRRNDGVRLGVTRRLEARVGASLVLRGFYGTSGSDIKDLVIARTRVRLESPIPAGQLGPWGSAGWRQYVSVGCISGAPDAATDFSALPTGRLGADEAFGGTTASGDFAHVEKDGPASQGADGGSGVQVNVEEDWRKAAGTADAWQPTTMLVQATVCTSNGSTDSTNNTSALRQRRASRGDETVSYEFHAKPDGTDGVMIVRYVQPVGGLGQGLFRVPRVGDRILVIRYSPSGTSVGGINYLMGYLPGKDMPHVTRWNEKNARQMDAMTLRYDQTETMKKDLCEGKGTADNEINEYNKLTAADRFDGAPSFRRGKKQNTFSELGFYDDHLSEGMDKRLGQRGALANLQSTGDVQISANDQVDVSARNIRIGCHGWKVWRNVNAGVEGKDEDKQAVDGRVVVDDISELVVKADRRIVLEVHGSALVIDRNGILLDSARWPGARGCNLFDSRLLVSGGRGVDVSGANVNLTGVFGTSMGDSAGGSVQTFAGSVQLSGSLVKQATMTKVGAGLRLAATVAQGTLTAIPSAISPSTPSVDGNLGSVGALIGSGVDAYFFAFYNDEMFAGVDKDLLNASAVFRCISALLDTVAFGVRMETPECLWDDPDMAFSMMDGIVVLSMVWKLASWTLGWIALTGKVVIPAYSSKVTLRPRGIYVDAPKLDSFTLNTNVSNGPAAGVEIGSIASLAT